MNDHRFILRPYSGRSSRHRCPQCHHNNVFKRYIDVNTNSDLADHVGRCDREQQCGYHFTPRQYFAQNPGEAHTAQNQPSYQPPVQGLFHHLPVSLMRDSMVQKAYIHNNFILFLVKLFRWEVALQAAEKYLVGTSKYWHGATVFWQQDRHFKLRTGKIMLYNETTGKRIKQPFNHVTWVHKIIGHANYKLEQCFFGEHLLADEPNAVVCVTESEKTAVMASVMMPDYLWLAAGSLNGLDAHKCKALKGRTVWLFPDVGAYDNWSAKARELNLRMPTTNFTAHDEMELTATDEERANGADMADRWVKEVCNA